DVGREAEALMNHAAQAPDLVGKQKSRRPAAEMELDRFAVRVEQRLHQVHLPFEVAEVIAALLLVGGDDGRAAATPARRLAGRQMEIEGEVARDLVVGADSFDEELG